MQFTGFWYQTSNVATNEALAKGEEEIIRYGS
jgi:hypothetical protein